MNIKLCYSINMAMLITGFAVIITGIIKFFHYRSASLNFIHDYSGLIFAVLAIMHIMLHWKWFVNITKCMFRRKNERCDIKAE